MDDYGRRFFRIERGARILEKCPADKLDQLASALPLIFEVDFFPTKVFKRSQTSCDCEQAWTVLNTAENKQALRSIPYKRIIPDDLTKSVLCDCYGKRLDARPGVRVTRW